MRLPSPPLLVVTDRQQAARPLGGVIRAAVEEGCRWFSLREKDLSGAQQKQLASALLPVTHAFGARLTIHGDPDMAADAGLDGVHLKAGGDARAARARIGENGIVGVSIHSVAEARALDPTIVDYAIAGPVYATSSKPGYGPAFGPGGLRSIVDASRVPIVGIGGIEANRVGDLIAAGAAGIAVMGGVMRAQDPGVEVRRLLAALASAQPRPR